MGVLVERTRRELTEEEVTRIADTYHAWRGEANAGAYQDILGFCKAAKLEEVREHGHVLTPGRYVGAEAAEDDDATFQEKMQKLTQELASQMQESQRLDGEIKQQLARIGWVVC
jgi:type I restriction enzyme M protein